MITKLFKYNFTFIEMFTKLFKDFNFFFSTFLYYISPPKEASASGVATPHLQADSRIEGSRVVTVDALRPTTVRV